MLGCKRAKGLLAQSLYEELGEADRRTLETHLARCESCRTESESLGELVSAIPVDSAMEEVDLLPRVRAGLRDAPEPIQRDRFRWVLAGAVAAMALVFTVFGMVPSDAPSDTVAQVNEDTPAPIDPLETVLAESAALDEQFNFSESYVVLSKALEESPEGGSARDVQQRIADLAFEELRWYSEAYAGYNALRAHHGKQFRSRVENINRLEMLDESRGVNADFASLYALDAARRSEDFDSFETIISQYPATYVASLAADDMAHASLVVDEDMTPLLAMETALNRCTHPIAIAQLKMELGRLHQTDGADLQKARALFEDVRDSGNTVLAKRASVALESLGQ